MKRYIRCNSDDFFEETRDEADDAEVKKNTEKSLEVFRYAGDVFSGALYHLFGVHIKNVSSTVYPTKCAFVYSEVGNNSYFASFLDDVANPDNILKLPPWKRPQYNITVSTDEFNWNKIEIAKYMLHEFYDEAKYIYENLDDITKRQLEKLNNTSDSFIEKMYSIGKSLPTSVANASTIELQSTYSKLII